MTTATVAALLLTLRVSAVATLLVLVPGTLLAYLLARRDFPGKSLLTTAVLLPLVLPPTAVGYLLLELISVDGPLGRERLGFDLDLLLTWKGAAIASAVMATPLVVQTARVTFEGIDPRLEAMARTLGHGRVRTFTGTTLPLAARGLLAAAILGFARAMGEFGASVTVAGSIPGKTRTLASGIFAAQQVGDAHEAAVLLGVSIAAGSVAVLASERLVRRRPHQRHAR